MAFSQISRTMAMAVLLGSLAAVSVGQNGSPTTARVGDKVGVTAAEQIKALQKRLKEVEVRADIEERVHSFYSNSVTWIISIVFVVLLLPSIFITLWIWNLEQRRDRSFEEGEERLKGEIGVAVRGQIDEALAGLRDEMGKFVATESEKLQAHFDGKQSEMEGYLLSTVLVVQGRGMLESCNYLSALLSYMEACTVVLGSQHPQKLNQFLAAGIGIEKACKALAGQLDSQRWNMTLIDEIRTLKQKVLADAAGEPGEQMVIIQHERQMKWLDSEDVRLEGLEMKAEYEANENDER